MRSILTKVSAGFLLFVVSVFYLYPFYWMIMASVLPSGSSFVRVPILYPYKITLQSYQELFQTRPMGTWLVNTLIVSLSSTILAIAFSIFGAYSLSRFKFFGHSIFGYGLFVAQMIPATLLIIPLYLSFSRINQTNTLLGVAISFSAITIPLATWLLWSFFQSVPIELEEAAMVDGCNRLGALFRITLPLSLPGISSTSLFCFLEGWNQYLFAYVLTTDQSKWVVSLGLYSFIGQFRVEVEQMMAASFISTLPALVVFLLLQRWIVQGLTVGALKG